MGSRVRCRPPAGVPRGRHSVSNGPFTWGIEGPGLVGYLLGGHTSIDGLDAQSALTTLANDSQQDPAGDMTSYDDQRPRSRREPAPRTRARSGDVPPARTRRPTREAPVRGARPHTTSGRAGAPRRPSGRRPARRPRRRWVRIVLLIAALLAVTLAVSGCVLYNSVSANLPDPSKPLRGTEQSTRITDRNGAVITELFTDQNRTNVTLKDIPPVMRNAIVATEDQRYYQHQGVDFLGMMRAAFADVLGGKAAQGGSTITQQYVKKAFLTPDKTIKRKIAEAVLAYRVEQTYSKDKILEMYLNTIYFGHGAYGISTAAETFFGKPVSALTAPEAALLAGVVKSPANYSPYLQPASAKLRRDTVLMQMRDQGYLKPAEYATAIATPIVVAPLKRGSKVAPYFVEYVRDQLVKQYGSDLVYRGGLKVTTTLDLGLQTAAENAVAKALSKPGDPSAAVVTTDPKTGGILVMVGGRDFASQQYNVVTQGHRQPGSAFKPFLLATALDQGVSPEQTYESGPMKIDVPGSGQWSVTGASGGGSGPVRLRLATWDSINSVFAQLIMQVGAGKVATTAKAMGIATPITAVPAIALGGIKEGVTPLEMAVAYGTLAHGGTKMEPFGVLEVRDASGLS